MPYKIMFIRHIERQKAKAEVEAQAKKQRKT